MSRTDLSFAFAQARLQSRFGERPAAADWQHLEATRDLGAVLQVLRGGRLARWTSRLAAKPPLHDIERRLREEWLHAVDEVAAWQPPPWREGVRWMRWITYIPALQKLARGGRAPAWSYRESPLVDGEKLICTPGAQDAMLVALDKLTGNSEAIQKCKAMIAKLALPRIALRNAPALRNDFRRCTSTAPSAMPGSSARAGSLLVTDMADAPERSARIPWKGTTLVGTATDDCDLASSAKTTHPRRLSG